MRNLRYVIALTFFMSIFMWGTSTAAEEHWVNDELAGFKQLIYPVVKTVPSNGIASEAEWESVNTNFVNEEKLDKPIFARDWAIMLKMILDLPEAQTEQLLKMYVYGLTDDEHILREDAVGGLVKLLTIDYIKGSGSAEELKPANNLKDIGEVSEMHEVLVRIAYCEGILDSTVKDFFRPKDELTNSEAVSMLYKVIRKYDIRLKTKVILKQQHWASGPIKVLAGRTKNNTQLANIIEDILYDDNANNPYVLDEPIRDENWNNLLAAVLKQNEPKYEKETFEGYTYGLAENGYVPRDKAVAGLMKLLDVTERVEARDAADEELKAAALRFSDFNAAFDTSKLAICLSEGLISGYTDGSFKPKQLLTNAEAVTLISKILNKTMTP